MEEKIDEFDEEVEKLEEESKTIQKKEKSSNVETKTPTEKYVAFYQQQRIGIVDTLTDEVVIEGLQDLTTAKLEALKLNKLDRIGLVTGVD